MSIASVIIVLYNQKEPAYIYRYDKNIVYILIDNTPSRDLKIEFPNVLYIPLGRNEGIAVAQNIGIKKALKIKSKYVIFFDQDSLLDVKYIQDIIQEYLYLSSINPNIGCVGPLIINKDNDANYKNPGSFKNSHYDSVDSIISSGSLIPIDVLKQVGYMKETLFIDYVDFEWCWRAKSMGYSIIQTSNVCLSHKVGIKSISILRFKFLISSVNRYYYQYRNMFILMKLKYVPKRWKVSILIRKIIEPFILVWRMNEKMKYINNIIIGIKDGIKNR